MMNSSSTQQRQEYRRNPTQVIHSSTFHPQHHAAHTSYQQVLPSTFHSTGHYSTSSSLQHTPVVLPPAQLTPPDASPAQSGFSLAKLAKYANPDEIKGLVDRFGGLDGILATVTKVQKVVSTVGQIAPMVKVFSGLGKKSSETQEEATSTPARRKSSTSSRVRNGRRIQYSSSNKARRPYSGQRPSGSNRKGVRKSTPLSKRPPLR